MISHGVDAIFHDLDPAGRGFIMKSDLRRYFEATGVEASDAELEAMLTMTGSPSRGRVDRADVERLVGGWLGSAGSGRGAAAPRASPAEVFSEDDAAAADAEEAQYAAARAARDADARLVAEVMSALCDACFSAGQHAIASGLLSADQIEERAAEVFVALPALALLDVAAGREDDRFDFGQACSGVRAPPRADASGGYVSRLADVFVKLEDARVLLLAGGGARGSGPQGAALRAAVCHTIVSATDDGTRAARHHAREREGADNLVAVQIAGPLQAAAATVTQLEAFKDAFENVLALLEAVAAVATPRVDAR